MNDQLTEQTEIVVTNHNGLILLSKIKDCTVSEFYNDMMFTIRESTRLKTNLLEKRIDYLETFKNLDRKYPRLFLKALSFYKRISSKKTKVNQLAISKNSQSTLDQYCKMFVNYFNEVKMIESRLIKL